MITQEQIFKAAEQQANNEIGDCGNVNDADHYAWLQVRDSYKNGARWAIEQDKWISAEEQYPELHAWVIVNTPYCAYGACPAKWNGVEWISCNRATVMNVTHWRILPEPPKTEIK